MNDSYFCSSLEASYSDPCSIRKAPNSSSSRARSSMFFRSCSRAWQRSTTKSCWPRGFWVVLEMQCCEFPRLIGGTCSIPTGIDRMLDRFYPTIASTSQWFTRKKGLAMGLVIAGSSLGGICWPFILQGLFKSVGFPWGMRITGFICLAFLLPSILLVSPRLPPKQSQVSKKDLSDAFKDPRYTLLVVAMFFVFWGMFLPFYYLPLYGLSHHMTVDMANNLVATLNAGSFVGRLASGILADKYGR